MQDQMSLAGGFQQKIIHMTLLVVQKSQKDMKSH